MINRYALPLVLTLLINLPVQADANLAVIQQFYQLIDQRPLPNEIITALLADNLQHHTSEDWGFGSRRDQLIAIYQHYAKGAPDNRHRIELIEPLPESRVLVRWKRTGTHTGKLLDIPATNKSFEINGMAIYRVDNGRISEVWGFEQQLGMLIQLGVLD